KKNGVLLVLGTKRQAVGVLEEEKKRLSAEGTDGVYFVTKRWIGGTLTNYSEVAKNYKKLKDIAVQLKDANARSKFTKKELSDMDKTRQKLEGFYGGVAEMPALPDAIFIIDTHQEHVAAQEAHRAGIPTAGITDTNADPTIIDYPIPANDDAVGSIKLITDYIFDAWIEGKKAAKQAAEVSAAKEKKEEEARTKLESGSKNKESGEKENTEKSAQNKKEDPKKVSEKNS
ncbi:MAG: 30S ribosomal protein S2, partial [Rhabdochlamydiaceae bacterium]